MTGTAPAPTVPATGGRATALARQEIRHYARHPVFWVGVLLTALTCVSRPDVLTSSLGNAIVPAAGLGLFGTIVMASLTRRSDRASDAAGIVSASQRARTAALAAATVVPLLAGLAWFAWAVWAFQHWPPPPNGAPFGGVSDGWAYAVMFGQAVVASVGGPLVGLVVARWVPRRGAAPVAVVLLVLATILMQGLFEPLRFLRPVMPWTHWAGQFGVDGDADRIVILAGSPYWWVAYLLALCAIGVVLAMLRDEEVGRRRLAWVLAGLVLVAAVLCALAITGGVHEQLVNPLPSGLGA